MERQRERSVVILSDKEGECPLSWAAGLPGEGE